RVLVVTGDGELLMNVGSLATIAVLNPPNLSILCVDNGHYGETGYQRSHTSLGVDLEKIAAGSGIRRSLTVEREAEIAEGAASSARATARPSCSCASSPPSRRPTSATSTRQPAACGSARRCWG